MSDTKSKLRKSLKQARLELTTADYTRKSRAICERLEQAIDWSEVKTLHFFEPILELLEPDISDFITDIEDKFPSIRMAAPRLINDSWQMVVTHGDEVTHEFDVVIVPMLGFDPETLHRLGYGGGFYDRFLATQPQARKIGICFEQGRLSVSLPHESHDVSLDSIITDKVTLSK